MADLVSLAIALPAIPIFAVAGMGEAALSSALCCLLLLGFVWLRRSANDNGTYALLLAAHPANRRVRSSGHRPSSL